MSGFAGSEEPLLDPPTDTSVKAVNNLEDVVVGVPGSSFPISLDFVADAPNVVGGGIRFEGSDEVQWTLLENVMGQTSGTLDFAYVVDSAACDDLSNLCHQIPAEEFVITQDGAEFKISDPVSVTLVLQCATCDSTSCVEIVPVGACVECPKPMACDSLFNRCFGPGAPYEGTTEANVFEQFFGERGALWRSKQTCAEGEAICELFERDQRCEF